MALDQHILDTLSDEERAIYEGDDVTPEERAAMEEIVSEGDDDSGNDEAEAGDDADDEPGGDDQGETIEAESKTEEPAAAAPESEPVAAQEEPVRLDDSTVNRQAISASYRAELPPDLSDRLASLESRESDLAAAYKSGELEFDDYRAKVNELSGERAALDRAITKAEIASEMAQQNAAQQWESAVARLAEDAAKNDGIDYRKDAAKQRDLDVFIKALAADSENVNKSMDWFLQEAHRRVKALHGVVDAPAATKPAPTKPAAQRKPPIDGLPKTLAQVPGGDGPGDVSGEFANLDALEGESLEDAVRRMTPAQRERYLRG